MIAAATIEDPVEYEIPGINQSQAKPAIGLTLFLTDTLKLKYVFRVCRVNRARG